MMASGTIHNGATPSAPMAPPVLPAAEPASKKRKATDLEPDALENAAPIVPKAHPAKGPTARPTTRLRRAT
jgi:hypothetical protein